MSAKLCSFGARSVVLVLFVGLHAHGQSAGFSPDPDFNPRTSTGESGPQAPAQSDTRSGYWNASPTSKGARFAPQWDVKINPLGLLLRRYSADLEYLFVPHFAASVNTHYWHYQHGGDPNKECDGFDCSDFDAIGGELGIRFYTGEESASGFWIGPTVVGDAIRFRDSDAYNDHLIQVGFDLGGQFVFSGRESSGFVLGFGAGYMPVRWSTPFYKGDSYIGVFPVRLLLQVGYAF